MPWATGPVQPRWWAFTILARARTCWQRRLYIIANVRSSYRPVGELEVAPPPIVTMDEAYKALYSSTLPEPEPGPTGGNTEDTNTPAAQPSTATHQVRNASSGMVHAYTSGTSSVCRHFKRGTKRSLPITRFSSMSPGSGRPRSTGATSAQSASAMALVPVLRLCPAESCDYAPGAAGSLGLRGGVIRGVHGCASPPHLQGQSRNRGAPASACGVPLSGPGLLFPGHPWPVVHEQKHTRNVHVYMRCASYVHPPATQPTCLSS